MNIVVAACTDWGIGLGGTQQLVLSEDRRRFKEMTMGGTVIAGRKTLEDFPGGKPLPGRRNIILSHSTDFTADGAVVVHSIGELFNEVENSGDCESFVIGGASIYRLLLPYCSCAYVTKIHARPISDAFFPNLDMSPQWELADLTQPNTSGGISYSFCTYKNRYPEQFFTGERD